jgi:hypothetical protein
MKSSPQFGGFPILFHEEEMIVRTDCINTYFLILDRRYTEEQWLAAAGVRPGSPAAGIAARAYACFFRCATDVVREYRKYYEREYRNLWTFLYWHYMIDEDVINIPISITLPCSTRTRDSSLGQKNRGSMSRFGPRTAPKCWTSP